MPIKKLFIKEDDSPKKMNDVDVMEILASIPDVSDYEGQGEYNLIAANMDGVETVEDVYSKFDMTDNKIYEVVPYIDSLPNTMDTVSKKTTLLNLLQNAAKLDLADLVDNADKCLDALKSARGIVIEKSASTVQDMEEIIAMKRREIETLRSNIEVEMARCDRQVALYDEESDKIRVIKNHIV
ncbi:MAG: hypothetical protein FWC91_02285 [Defluviitaleaceae bacterium]|nr:hypothetical protein [Defluviitaleaceae bacterium]